MRRRKTVKRNASSHPRADASRAQQRSTARRNSRRRIIFRIDEGGLRVFSVMEPDTFRPRDKQEFSTERGLVRLTSSWPISRLVDMWNNLAGVKPVRKFTDRKTALHRIWKAIQALEVVSDRRLGSDNAVQRSSASQIPTKSVARGRNARSTKADQIVALLMRPSGATLDAIQAATGWRAHSVRGFISGQLRKRMGLNVQSLERNGGRVYAIRK